jgi:ATP-dependent Clp protease ATP-binding subunit ClpA
MPRNPFRRGSQDRFDKFTERARKVLVFAQEEARLLNHNYIGTEHILLGLLRMVESAGGRVLTEVGVNLADVRTRVGSIADRGEGIAMGEIGLDPNAKLAIEAAVDEARRMGHNYIGTEHLLLGLLRVEEGVAARILSELGLSLEESRRQVLAVLQVYAGDRDQGDRFDKFTERARKVLQLAQEEAERFNHNYIGTEHILLGLAREGDGVAARVLRNLGIDLHKVRSAVEFIIGRGDRMVLGEIGLTPRAKRVIELAVDEARRLNHHYIGTEHLLLGLVREGEGIAAGVLESLGVSLEKVRAQVIGVLKSSPGYARPNLEPALTRSVQVVLRLAQEEARRLNHNSVGVEHVFLTLVGLPEGQVFTILKRLGLELVKTREVIEAITGKGNRNVTGEIDFTPQVKQAVQFATDLGRRLRRADIGGELLLLGILRLGDSVVVDVLSRFGVHPDTLRAEVLEGLLVPPGMGGPVRDAEARSAGVPVYISERDDVAAFDVAQPAGSAVVDFASFARGAWDVLRLATAEAHRLQHGYIGTAHLLLGLLSEEEGVLPHVLRELDLPVAQVRAVVEEAAGKGEQPVSDGITLTPGATRALALAVEEAEHLQHKAVGPEHILLGLLREGEESAADALEGMGLPVRRVRAKVLEMLGSNE